MSDSLRGQTVDDEAATSDVCTSTENARGRRDNIATASSSDKSPARSTRFLPDNQTQHPRTRSKSAQEHQKHQSSSETSPLREQPLRAPVTPQWSDGTQSLLSQSRQTRLAQLRARERSHGQDGNTVHLQRALRDIDRMGSALSIDTTTREMAAVLFRTARNHDLLQGRTVAAVTAASLLAATRVSDHPRPLSKLTQVARINDADKIAQTYAMLTRNLDLTIPPVDPTQYLGQIRSTVEANYVYEKEAAAAIEAATHEALTGHSPTVIAAAALYAAGIIIPSLEILPQGELATAADCSQSSIRNNYLTLVAAHPSVSASPADLRAPDGTRYRPHTLSSKLGNL